MSLFADVVFVLLLGCSHGRAAGSSLSRIARGRRDLFSCQARPTVVSSKKSKNTQVASQQGAGVALNLLEEAD